jgi:hypothetical protein
MTKSVFTLSVIIIIGILILNTEAYSQNESLSLCDVNIKIGMNFNDIIPLIASSCVYTTHNDWGKIYTIWDPIDKNKVLGVLAFDSENNLNYVSKNWYSKEINECINSWETLFKLLSKYQFENQPQAYTSEKYETSYEAKLIQFFINRRTITVIIKEDGVSSIDESLR